MKLFSRVGLAWRRPAMVATRRSSPRVTFRLYSKSTQALGGSRLGAAIVATVASIGAIGIGYSIGAASPPPPSALLSEDRLPPVQYATLTQMNKAIDEIREALSEDAITTDPDDLEAHGFSNWSPNHVQRLPVAVAYPRSTEDVSAISQTCHKWKVPVVPYSGGSSLEGHTSAPFGGVSVDFAYMDQIVELHEEDMDVTVQPGVCWADLNRELEKRGTGLFFPMDPAPTAKIGGMIATNCSGTNAVRYGTMRDWVINLTVVLADGSIIKTRRRPRKCSAGYNINGLIVGSEGTLGVITEATLKLAVKPQHTSVAVVSFPSIKSAVSAASSVIRHGVQVAAVELMDEEQMRIVNAAGGGGGGGGDVRSAGRRVWREMPTLFFKFSGTKVSVDDNITSVRQIIQPFQPRDFEFAKDSKEQEVLWSARKESLLSLIAMKEEGETMWNTDVAVPLSRLAELVEMSKEEAKSLGLKACVKGHVGDSNFHENITYAKDDPVQAANAELAVRNMVSRALDMQGTCTGEHGVGWGKKKALEAEVGPDTIVVMKLLKTALDPTWIMNPGKIFDRD